ncbi:MAG: glycosyltransferase [Promethearchaeota archaeon]
MKDRVENINYCTHSNLSDLSYGGCINDNKFIISIPSDYNITKVFPNRNKDNTLSFLNSLKLILRLIKLSMRSRQTFVIRATRPGFIPIFFKKLRKHKLVLNMGCTPFSTIERNAFYRNPTLNPKYRLLTNILMKIEFQFEKYLVRKADLIFVENKQAKKLVEKFGGKSAKIVLAPYYVQDYFLTTRELKYNFKDGEPLIVGYTGRFHKYDKLAPLIDATKILKDQGFPIIIKLIGDGPTKIEIQNKVRSLNLKDNVQFLGPQQHEMVSKIIDTEHVLILPMVNNICPSTIPIKMLEGIIKGKVILTNKAGNILSLFNPYIDLVLEDFSDPKIIAEKIIDIAHNYDKYQEKARVLRNRHLKTHNHDYFCNQVVENLRTIKS